MNYIKSLFPHGRIYTVGTDKTNDIVVEDEYASGLHAIFILDPDTACVYVADTGSTNGTWLITSKGREVRVFLPMKLSFGDSIKIGKTIIPGPLE